MHNPERISLTPSEVQIVIFLARVRQKKREEAQNTVHEKNHSSPQHSLDNPDATGAEFALAKYLNVYPDMTIALLHPEYDLQLHNGYTLDVKNSDHKMCVSFTKKIGQCEFFVYVQGKLPTYEIIGYAWEEHVLQEKNKREKVHTDGKIGYYYSYNTEDLLPIKHLTYKR